MFYKDEFFPTIEGRKGIGTAHFDVKMKMIVLNIKSIRTLMMFFIHLRWGI